MKTSGKITVVACAVAALVPCLASGQSVLSERTIGSPGGDKDAACAKVGIDKMGKKLAE